MLYLNVQYFNKDYFKTKFDTTIHYYNALNICMYLRLSIFIFITLLLKQVKYLQEI